MTPMSATTNKLKFCVRNLKSSYYSIFEITKYTHAHTYDALRNSVYYIK